MAKKFAESKSLFEGARKLIPGGVNSPVRSFSGVGGHPIYFKKAFGSRVIDADGNEYIDFCQSWGPLILGHSHPEVVEAVRKAAKNGLSYGACHKMEITLAELILHAFYDFGRVRLVSSGTEAVMTALRIARAATERNLVVKFEGCYHGHYDGMLVKAGSGLATHSISTSKGIPKEIADTTLVAKLDNEESVEGIFKKHGDDIAAAIIEPLPANNGLLTQRMEFLQFLRDITEKHGSLLIFDEVISGFRLHFGGAYELFNVIPDMVTLGKIIGGGMPVGAVCGRPSEMDKLAPLGAVYQAGTLSGNPVSLAAGIKTLELLQAESFYDELDKLSRGFIAALKKSKIPYLRAQREGSIIWLYLDEGKFPASPDKISQIAMNRFKKIYWGLIEKGFYLPPSSYEVLFVSSAHTAEELSALAKALADELKKAE
ncbi:MAG: glutamate-1-semialdehyde 2,1-aminomutase [Myxococcota bacterium]